MLCRVVNALYCRCYIYYSVIFVRACSYCDGLLFSNPYIVLYSFVVYSIAEGATRKEKGSTSEENIRDQTSEANEKGASKSKENIAED